MYMYVYIYGIPIMFESQMVRVVDRPLRRDVRMCVTAGTEIAVTAISAPADVPLPDGVRPRSAWEPAQTRCLHVTYVPLTRTACPVSMCAGSSGPK